MSKFDDFYAKKSVTELLEKLKAASITPATMDKEWYDALINHLNERQISESEKIIMEHILSADINSSKTFNEMEQTIRKEKDNATFTSSDISSEAGRHTALKTVVGLISTLGYIVIVFGIIALFYLASNSQTASGVLALVISVVIALPLLAYSYLIHVFIDIEYNTRKTREEIKKLGK
jgi:hypothetical protein